VKRKEPEQELTEEERQQRIHAVYTEILSWRKKKQDKEGKPKDEQETRDPN